MQPVLSGKSSWHPSWGHRPNANLRASSSSAIISYFCNNVVRVRASGGREVYLFSTEITKCDWRVVTVLGRGTTAEQGDLTRAIPL